MRTTKGPSKRQLKKQLQELRRKCFYLWSAKVKELAGNKCEYPGCNKRKFLNAHHIESHVMNKRLRYDPRNGICLCPRHHKFALFSAHRSFIFMYEMMTNSRKNDLGYLQRVRGERHMLSKMVLLRTIIELGG